MRAAHDGLQDKELLGFVDPDDDVEGGEKYDSDSSRSMARSL
jgi:hypothetical protein